MGPHTFRVMFDYQMVSFAISALGPLVHLHYWWQPSLSNPKLCKEVNNSVSIVGPNKSFKIGRQRICHLLLGIQQALSSFPPSDDRCPLTSFPGCLISLRLQHGFEDVLRLGPRFPGFCCCPTHARLGHMLHNNSDLGTCYLLVLNLQNFVCSNLIGQANGNPSNISFRWLLGIISICMTADVFPSKKPLRPGCYLT